MDLTYLERNEGLELFSILNHNAHIYIVTDNSWNYTGNDVQKFYILISS